MAFVRKVRTGSGATAVQVVQKRHGKLEIINHVGPGHNPAEVALLVQRGREILRGEQEARDLGVPSGSILRWLDLRSGSPYSSRTLRLRRPRPLQNATGLSPKRIITTLRPIQSTLLQVGDHTHLIPPQAPENAATSIKQITGKPEH